MPGLLPAKRPQKCGISGTWMCRPRRPAQAGRSASEARAWPASARREPGRMPGLSPEKRHMDVPPARRESAGARASAGFARAARRKPGRMPGLSPRQRHMDVPPAQARASGPERERGAGLARVREARAGQDARSLARDHPAEVRDQRHMDVPPAQARASGPERERGAGLARVREARDRAGCPVSRPELGRRQAGKARDFDSRIRRFESFRPSQNGKPAGPGSAGRCAGSGARGARGRSSVIGRVVLPRSKSGRQRR